MRPWWLTRRAIRAKDGRLRPSWRALLFLPVFLACMFLVFVVVSSVPEAEGGIGMFSSRALVAQAGSVLAALASSFVLLNVADKRRFRTLGFWFYGGWGREFGLGLGGGLVLMTVMVAPLAAGGWMTLSVAKAEPLGLLSGLAWSVGILVPAAAFEELLFRGYPFQRLVEGWGPWIPAVGLSLLFGLAHFNNPNATLFSTANTVLAGIWLAVAYLKTRALWLPIGLHFSWNFVMGFVYGVPISGHVLPWKVLQAAPGGPVWLTGGDYGVEGSILCTGVLVVATVWMVKTDKLRVVPQMEACLRDREAAGAKELQSVRVAEGVE
jgi:hypothetical protein